MTIQAPLARRTHIIPESAPFTPEQRAWLDGFFAGLLSLDAPGVATVDAGVVPGMAAAGEDDTAPWHDPSLSLAERMQLAEGKPAPKKLYAAMAQQDCGQCGYLCKSYAEALAKGDEKRANLCVPGGKETSRALRDLLATLAAAEAPAASPGGEADPKAAAEAAAPATRAAPLPGYARETPVEARFIGATRLNAAGSEKDTRHVVFDIGSSGLAYEPGDSFGILPCNDPSLVDAVLTAIQAPGDFPIGGRPLRELLSIDYALGAAPDMLFELISHMVGGERRQKARAMAKGGDPDGDLATLDVLAALEKFPGVRPDPEAFLEALEPLQPRLYSISSSPLAHPGELHLTVDGVRYDIGNRTRLGVASTFLADRLVPGEKVKVYIQKAHGFALPTAGETPIIMIGPGTGIAPFRSFLWHRHAQKSKGKAWLFFGHQHEASDFFYRDELSALQAAGTLTHLSTAWSRDGVAKVYVQNRIRESGPQVWSWLKAGAHVYVCGDAKRMARDVEAAIMDVSAKAGSMSDAGARDFIAELKATGRYQTDVY